MKAHVKVGIRQVAAEAGVSITTVSQVYNHKGEVAEATRERVLAVGTRLGYRANPIGRALRSGRSHVLGIAIGYRESAVWEQTYMPYYRSIIAGAAIEAVEHGYSISAAPATADGELQTTIPLDGVIVVDPVADDALVERALADGLAVVTDGGYEADGRAMLRSVRSDMARGIPDVLDVLAALDPGEPLRPGLFIGPRLDSYTGDTVAAYRSWCADRGLEPVVTALELGQAPIDAARAMLSDAHARVNAVHCLNDTYGNALLAAAAERDLDVPGDLRVSIAGDARGLAADARAVYLDIDPVRSGAACVRTLIALLDDGDPPDVLSPVTVVPPRSRLR
ncbi:LacI family DNA-binding transcriptional regulator [Agromyces aureus]|uniref:HTH lacI-type domain-containing protein n=1 Tax=Agromyces aureus TaxID=453304 RepID=A0A191WJR2_9MICO|nr:LacI family DNA-binding transcriptional regulator [Agromyces aureus]ANJ28565.1 hypothetical protein ATC03_19530 [Agromyces aureus]